MALTAALQVLVDFAVAHVDEVPREEQVKVYQALAETLPSQLARQNARQIAEAQSRIAALQLDFKGLLTQTTPEAHNS